MFELWHEPQPMQGEGFFEPFLEAVQCRCIPQRQGGFEGLQCGFGVVVGLLVVSIVEGLSDLILL